MIEFADHWSLVTYARWFREYFAVDAPRSPEDLECLAVRLNEPVGEGSQERTQPNWSPPFNDFDLVWQRGSQRIAFGRQADRNFLRSSVVSVGFSSGKKCPP